MRQGILKIAQNAALHRARAERGLVAAVDQEVFRGVVELELEPTITEQALEVA